MPCREEKSLVDVFAMEMLVCALNSLKQAHKDPKSLGETLQLLALKGITSVCNSVSLSDTVHIKE